MVHLAEGSHTVRSLNTLRADAGKQVEHTMVFLQVVQVGINLCDEAVRRAAPLADQLVFRDGRRDPGWLSTHFGGRELSLCNQFVSWLLCKAKLDKDFIVSWVIVGTFSLI